jgi:preprotein translocase subunit SecF
MAARGGAFGRLYRGETTFDFAGRWRRWFIFSGTIILIGMISVAARGVDFSIDFKGGTVWEVPTHASVSQIRDAIGKVNGSLSQATVQVLTNRETGQRTIEVSAAAKTTDNQPEITAVSKALAAVSHVNSNQVQINAIGPSWGSDITGKAIKAVIIFLIAVTLYIWLRFEGKMAIAALVALLHDILITVGIYSLSGFQVSPDTVIAFLTILGYSLYDTIVVFDKVQENTRGLASSNRLTYTETVNLSMNQVLARSMNTSFVAIIPILSILVIGAGLLGASALNDFGLALFIGLTTGAYSSIFIASPLLALLKEREPRYSEIRKRLGSGAPRRLSPRAAAAGEEAVAFVAVGGRRATGGGRPIGGRGESRPQPAPRRPASTRPTTAVDEEVSTDAAGDTLGADARDEGAGAGVAGSGVAGSGVAGSGVAGSGGGAGGRPGSAPARPGARPARPRRIDGTAADAGEVRAEAADSGAEGDDAPGAPRASIPPRSGNRPPPRPRKKKRR